jgi:hypothetical protein
MFYPYSSGFSGGATEGVSPKGKMKCPENAQNVIVSF